MARSMPDFRNCFWSTNGIPAAGTGTLSTAVDQLKTPCSVCVGDDGDLYIADYENHRIVKWNCNEGFVKEIVGNKENIENISLKHPSDVVINTKKDLLIICDRGNQRVITWPIRSGGTPEIIVRKIDCFGLAIDDDDYLYISDTESHQVQRFRTDGSGGEKVAGGNGYGSGLNQFDRPARLFVDEEKTLYVSDVKNQRIMRWSNNAIEGCCVAGKGDGYSRTPLLAPGGLFADSNGDVYVTDYLSHKVICCSRQQKSITCIIGGRGQGSSPGQLNGPDGLAYDKKKNIYVADSQNHRVLMFQTTVNTSTICTLC